MNFYDQHMHSNLSFDCNENPFNYISKNTQTLVFTDHLDLENHANDKQDDIPNFDQLVQWRKDFAKSKNIELLLGVEVGYVPHHKDRLTNILKDYNFDIKLLSCHQNRKYDYMDEVNETPEVMINEYLDQLQKALTDAPNCQIMTHFDYGFRIHDFTISDIKRYEKN